MRTKNRAKHILSQRGFALVVTLSLMILLTVIVVGLLTRDLLPAHLRLDAIAWIVGFYPIPILGEMLV